MALIYLILSSFAVSALSFIGMITLSVKQTLLKKAIYILVAFSAGALIGDSFIHLLPEALESGISNQSLSIFIFAGIFFFFLLEKILRWRHCHDISCHTHPRHLGMMNLIGDSIHNIIDGILIGVSFSVSIPLGITTTIAVLLHEIPQELGDFGVLLHSGFSVKKALFFNFLTSLSAVIAAVITYFIGQNAEVFVSYMLPFTIGSFIYIALSDLVPELHKDIGLKQSSSHVLGLAAGISVMFLLLLFE